MLTANLLKWSQEKAKELEKGHSRAALAQEFPWSGLEMLAHCNTKIAMSQLCGDEAREIVSRGLVNMLAM